MNLAAATGPRGLLYRPTDTPQPYFDDVKRGFYPLYHVIAGLAGAAGKKQIAADSAAADEGGERGVPRCRRAGGVAGEPDRREADRAGQGLSSRDRWRSAQLDEGSFAAATKRQDFLGKLIKKVKKMPASIPLRPYAVVRIAAAS